MSKFLNFGNARFFARAQCSRVQKRVGVRRSMRERSKRSYKCKIWTEPDLSVRCRCRGQCWKRQIWNCKARRKCRRTHDSARGGRFAPGWGCYRRRADCTRLSLHLRLSVHDWAHARRVRSPGTAPGARASTDSSAMHAPSAATLAARVPNTSSAAHVRAQCKLNTAAYTRASPLHPSYVGFARSGKASPTASASAVVAWRARTQHPRQSIDIDIAFFECPRIEPVIPIGLSCEFYIQCKCAQQNKSESVFLGLGKPEL